MAIKYKLSAAQWDKMKDFLPGKESDPGRSAGDNRRFVEAVLWIGESGCKWRSLPEEFGNRNSVFQRFRRWANKRVWQFVFNALAVSADTKWLMIDSTIVRAYQHSAGALKKTAGKKIKR
jgi:transposase